MTKRRLKSLLFALLMGITAVFFPSCSKEETYRLVKINCYDGEVSVQREEKLNAFEGLQLISDDTVSVGDKSFLELLADSDKHIAAEENTGFVLHSTGDENNGDITIDLLYGKSLFTIDNKLTEGSTFAVNTPNATLSVRGTSFSVAYDEETKTTNVEVYSGTVQLNSGDEEMLIEKDGTASIISTDEGIKIIANSTAGNPNAIAVPENTEKLFAIAMTYPQQEGYSAINAEYKVKASDFTAKETGIGDNDIVFQKFIGLIKNHNSEISKYFEENKANAVANTNKLLDVTDWFKNKITVGDKEFRIDKAIMDMSIYGSNIERKYVTSDTYKVNTEGVDMYFCANGVEISFYGGFEKAAVVATTTTATTTTTAPETTVPETTTAETAISEITTAETTTTTAVTTVSEITTTKAATTTKAPQSSIPKEYDERLRLSYFGNKSDYDSCYLFNKKVSKLFSDSVHLHRWNVNGHDNIIGELEGLHSLFRELSDTAISHNEETDKKYFDKFMANGFESVQLFLEDRYHLNSTINEDVTDWFPDTVEFTYDNNTYRFIIKYAELVECTASAQLSPTSSYGLNNLPEYTDSNIEGEVYISSYNYHIDFYGDVKKTN